MTEAAFRDFRGNLQATHQRARRPPQIVDCPSRHFDDSIDFPLPLPPCVERLSRATDEDMMVVKETRLTLNDIHGESGKPERAGRPFLSRRIWNGPNAVADIRILHSSDLRPPLPCQQA